MGRSDYPAKYLDLIDDEMWAFIERTESFYPPKTASFDIERQREIYDGMAAAFHAGRPDGIEVRDDTLSSIPVRRYRADTDGPLGLYMHGGGFVVGGLESHDDVCAEISDRVGIPVVSVDYRLSPEHPHPAAFDDCLTVAHALDPRRLILIGDSAGANVAAALSHKLRPENPRGQVLIYPGLGGDIDRGSYVEHAECPMLTRADIEAYVRMRGEIDVRSVPLRDPDISGLPPTVIFAAECDPLCDDGPAYADRIVKAGGQATVHVEAGLTHGYLRARHMSVRAKDSFDRIISAIAAMAD